MNWKKHDQSALVLESLQTARKPPIHTIIKKKKKKDYYKSVVTLVLKHYSSPLRLILWPCWETFHLTGVHCLLVTRPQSKHPLHCWAPISCSSCTWDFLTGFIPNLTLLLHFLCGSSHYVDIERRQADRRVHRDVLGGAVGCKDPHVGLIREEGPI